MAWQLDGNVASLNVGELQARIDLARPRDGISQIVPRGVRQDRVQLFQLASGEADPGDKRFLKEFYVRGIDLVASYAETSDSPVSLEVYWRALTDVVPLCGVELWVSEQTNQLESDPQLSSASQLPMCDAFRFEGTDNGQLASLTLGEGESARLTGESGSGAFLFRPHGADWSYGEMVHPADFSAAHIEAHAGGLSLVNQLFGRECLEKGVIRRARLRGLFVPRQDDTTHIAEAYRLFASSELPLTA